MLEFMPPNVFKAGIADVREQIGKLSEKDLVNVVYFPNTLVSKFERIFHFHLIVHFSHQSFYVVSLHLVHILSHFLKEKAILCS